MKKYEVMYILRPTLDIDQVKLNISNLSNVLTNNGATIKELKEIGLKELAYEIDKHKKGYYVWLLTEAGPEAVNELNRIIAINENVIRHIIVKEGM